MCLISTFLCISIRKPNVLQQLNERTTFNHIKEHHLGRKKKKHTGTRSEQDFTGNELVPLCVPSLLCLQCLDPVVSFPSSAGQMVSPRDLRIAQDNKTGTAETPGSTKVQGTATPLRSASPKTSLAQPQNPTLTGCIL